ncbi:VWA domain-containing protein [Aeromonas caviae]|uniref:VWA domain-containing protein n=1 Tax=Aeromonas caviae TaxID=648 RepID=A0AA43AKI0_AERCA|nr:VWA domain-containing protein [Aeromonas caviae]MDH0361033.1 VWA domain-containing protein [Aeromonas caviae]MDH1843086.1 VWA domain-containing protein [Aeromonas caviae]MDH1900273.1 VWA domain-containing protein [Aeromonas caviae]
MQSTQSKMLTIQIRLAMMANDFGLRTTWGNYSTAGTTQGVVLMPFFDAGDPVQAAAAMGFGMHEGAHHRYGSDFAKYEASLKTKGKVHRLLLNYFDDGRIDRMALIEYPGLRGEYEAIEQLFISKGMRLVPGANTPAIAVLEDYIAHYIGSELLNYKPLTPVWEQTRDLARQRFPIALLTRLEIISEMGVITSDFNDCWNSADMVLDAIKDALEDLKTQQPDHEPEAQPDTDADGQPDADADGQPDADADGQPDADADGQPDADADGQPDADADGQPNADADGQPDADADGQPNADADGQPDADADGQPDADADGQPDADADGQPDADADGQPEAGAAGGPNADDVVRSKQIQELEACLEAAGSGSSDVEGRDKGKMLASLIEADSRFQLDTPLRPHLDAVYTKIGRSVTLPKVLAASRPITQALMELVETETNCAPGLSRRGKRFVTSRFNRFKQGDLRVYRSKARNLGIDSAIMVLLDLSGSMNCQEVVAKNACLALALAVQQIDGAVIGIQSFGDWNVDLLRFREDPATTSSRLDLICAGGGTPMREGLSNAFLALMPEQAERKSMIVITDGEPDVDCVDTFNMVRQHGIDVFGIFIGQYANGKAAMDYYFKPGNWIAVGDILSLKRELFKLAKGTILAA